MCISRRHYHLGTWLMQILKDQDEGFSNWGQPSQMDARMARGTPNKIPSFVTSLTHLWHLCDRIVTHLSRIFWGSDGAKLKDMRGSTRIKVVLKNAVENSWLSRFKFLVFLRVRGQRGSLLWERKQTSQPFSILKTKTLKPIHHSKAHDEVYLTNLFGSENFHIGHLY